MAFKSSPRGSRPVRLITVHSAEGARTARSLAAFFSKPETQASSHVGIDPMEILNYVGYDRAAWTLRSGNPISDNAELCAFARWTRAQWMSTGTVDGVTNPLAMLRNTAAWIRSRCLARDIPMVKLTPAQVAAGHEGVIGHWDWTIGMRDGSHTDPGSGFPWDFVMDLARNPGGGGDGAPAPKPPTPGGALTKILYTEFEENMMEEIILGPTEKGGVAQLQLVHTGAAAVLNVIPLTDQAVFFGNPAPDAPVYCWGASAGGGMGGGQSTISGRDPRRAEWNKPQQYDIPAGTLRIATSYSTNGRFAVQIVPRALL